MVTKLNYDDYFNENELEIEKINVSDISKDLQIYQKRP